MNKINDQFLRQLEEKGDDMDLAKKKNDLKSSTEALICAAQEQALTTNYASFNVDKSVESPLFLMCHKRGEGVNHVISECSKLAQKGTKNVQANTCINRTPFYFRPSQ